jgi:hypothetical protein
MPKQQTDDSFPAHGGVMGAEWKDCVVTVIDVIGIRSVAESEKGAASTMMRELYRLARSKMLDVASTSRIDHAYAWNDSVLLLAFLDGNAAFTSETLLQLSRFKLTVDQDIGRSYAICVKGQAFPELGGEESRENGNDSRCTVLKASSYAMANCFLIEKELKRHRADWYVDSRLLNAVTAQSFAKQHVALMPSKKKRCIHMFKGYLHGEHLADPTGAANRA